MTSMDETDCEGVKAEGGFGTGKVCFLFAMSMNVEMCLVLRGVPPLSDTARPSPRE